MVQILHSIQKKFEEFKLICKQQSNTLKTFTEKSYLNTEGSSYSRSQASCGLQARRQKYFTATTTSVSTEVTFITDISLGRRTQKTQSESAAWSKIFALLDAVVKTLTTLTCPLPTVCDIHIYVCKNVHICMWLYLWQMSWESLVAFCGSSLNRA